jgi:hypothetical protein
MREADVQALFPTSTCRRISTSFNKAKLEEGNVATSWSAAPHDTDTQIDAIGDAVDKITDDLDGNVQMIIEEMGLSEQFANTRLSFIQGGHEVAYFSDNKLYVTQLEVIERISIGTSANGYLDIVTTPTGIGWKWRT